MTREMEMEMWCGRNSPCVYNKQNQTFDSDTAMY